MTKLRRSRWLPAAALCLLATTIIADDTLPPADAVQIERPRVGLVLGAVASLAVLARHGLMAGLSHRTKQLDRAARLFQIAIGLMLICVAAGELLTR